MQCKKDNKSVFNLAEDINYFLLSDFVSWKGVQEKDIN